MRLRTRLIALTVASTALLAGASLAAPQAQAQVFYLYPSSFYPAYSEAPSGVGVTFMNVDSASHRVVSYRVYGAQSWSLDVTLAPWESYTVPQRFYCLASSCAYANTYLFRVPEQSNVVVGYGYSYCSGYCGKLVVHR
jgi:plastocyanin